MSEARNAKFGVAQRRVQVSELYLQGWNQIAIAERLQVSRATISGDVCALQEQWRTSGIRNFDLMREQELLKLELLEREAWAGWQHSLKRAAPASTDGKTKGSRTESSVEEPLGDPRFLNQIHKCLKDRRAMLGLDAPLTVVDTSPLILDSPERRRERLNEIFNKLVAQRVHRVLPALTLEPEPEPGLESP